jgi:hypothetical protein
LVEDTEVLCIEGKITIRAALLNCAASWYHYYLQHPGHMRLEETLHATLYWKGMRNTIRSHVKNCRTCQVNKWHKHQYGKLPTKLVITNPWEALCVDLIGLYTLRGKDGTEIYFMCLTMIDPDSCWFEIVELSVTTDMVIPMDAKRQRGTKTHQNAKLPYFDKSSAMISNLVNKTWFSCYPHCQYIIYVELNSNFTPKPYVNHMGSSTSQPVSRTHKRLLSWSGYIKLLPWCSALLN